MTDTKDLEPVWFHVEEADRVQVAQPIMFDLQVNVNLRGTNTAGNVWFESKIFLSLDETLDANDIEVCFSFR